MKISILTLFPSMFSGPFDASIIKRAKEKKLVEIEFIDIRNFSIDKYKSVDDHPYGGGQGMIMRVDIIDRALSKSKKQKAKSKEQNNMRTILLDPGGKPYTQAKAKELSKFDHLILICGHYEGVDERVRSLVDEEISIGDYVLTGGELPAMVLIDSITRLIPDVLTKANATSDESFSNLLEYPQYTKPLKYKGKSVPKILLSGDHAKIAQWKTDQAVIKTKKQRPDLIK